MTLHDMIESDAETVFCNENDFAEPATYHAFDGCTGDGREISVVIIRQSLAILPEDGDVISPSFEVHVANDSTTGISSDEINCGGDVLEFAVRVGQCVSRRSIMRILDQDEGMMVLECR